MLLTVAPRITGKTAAKCLPALSCLLSTVILKDRCYYQFYDTRGRQGSEGCSDLYEVVEPVRRTWNQTPTLTNSNYFENLPPKSVLGAHPLIILSYPHIHILWFSSPSSSSGKPALVISSGLHWSSFSGVTSYPYCLVLKDLLCTLLFQAMLQVKMSVPSKPSRSPEGTGNLP